MTTAEMEALKADLEWRMTVPPAQLAHTVETGRCTDPRCTSCTPRTKR
jgi:hypothetical protein